MASLASLLDRFRPAPPPGQPGPLGVPTLTPRTTADELGPVFSLIDAIEATCAAIAAGGRRRAEQIQDDAAVCAAQVVRTAEQDARDARAAAMRAVRTGTRERVGAMQARARREADAVLQQGSAALPHRVERAVDRVLAIIAEHEDDPGD